jgi:hypothetical protein
MNMYKALLMHATPNARCMYTHAHNLKSKILLPNCLQYKMTIERYNRRIQDPKWKSKHPNTQIYVNFGVPYI